MPRTFDHLLLLGRPAAGKSEFIDFMKNTPEAERAETFHIGRFEEMDDFVWLWEKFLEDDLWEEAGHPRLYSLRYGENYGLNPNASKLYDLMLARFNREMAARYLPRPEFYDEGTLIIEYARGGEQGYASSLARLSREILERAAILYVQVSFDESWRRNVARYEEKMKHSILAHMVPRQTLEHFYRIDDWDALTGRKPEGYLTVGAVRVPFVTMGNEPELKERGPLAERYGPALQKLMKLSKAGRP
jgi:hypothetical protein